MITCSNEINDICVINRTEPLNSDDGDIQCNDKYSSCIINCDSRSSCGNANISSIIHCPLNGDKCIINCNNFQSCSYSTIYSYNTLYVEINIINSLNRYMNIHSPSNNGILYINISGGVFNNNYIHSSQNTRKIVIDCSLNTIQCNNNIINGSLISPSSSIINNGNHGLYFSCDGHNTKCQYNNIYCSLYDNIPCNIYCLSSNDLACKYMNIYSIYGLNNLNKMNDLKWICDDNNELICYNSKLYCFPSFPVQSSWIYNQNDKIWMLNGNCDKEYIPNNTISNISIQTTKISSIYSQKDNNNTTFADNRIFYISISIFLFITCIIPILYILHYKRKKKRNKDIRERSASFRKVVNNEPITSNIPKTSIDIISLQNKLKSTSINEPDHSPDPQIDNILLTKPKTADYNDTDPVIEAVLNNDREKRKQSAFIDDNQSFKSICTYIPSLPVTIANHKINASLPTIQDNIINNDDDNDDDNDDNDGDNDDKSVTGTRNRIRKAQFKKLTSLDFANLPTAISNSSYMQAVIMKEYNKKDKHFTTLSEMELAVIAKIPQLSELTQINKKNDKIMDNIVEQIQDDTSSFRNNLFAIDESIRSGNSIDINGSNNTKTNRSRKVVTFADDCDDDDDDDLVPFTDAKNIKISVTNK